MIKEDKTLHSSTKVLNFTTSRIFFFKYIIFAHDTNKLKKKANIKLALILEGAATYFLVLPTVDQCFVVA